MHQKQLLSISKKTFLNVLYILLGLIMIVSILTFLIPKGAYQIDQEGMIIEGTFQFVTSNNYPLWRYVIAPIEVLWHSDGLMVIMISLFLLILGGSFHVMDQSVGILLFGVFFVFFEESLALLPILILLSLYMGFDTMTGLAMGLL